MGDVTLTRGVRANLLQLQRNESLRLQVADRLTSGRRVNRVADDPKDFYAARAASNRVGDLFDLKSGINQAISSAGAADVGLKAVEDLTRQLRGIATAVRGGTAEQRQAAAEQFDRIRTQINSLAGDASYGGVALIDDPADSQTTPVGDLSGGAITVEGGAASAEALGIGTATGDYNGFASAGAADVGLKAVEDLTRQLRGIATAVRGGTAEQRQAAAEQFDRIRTQINSLAGDASYGGVALIDDPADSQTTPVGDLSGGAITVEGGAASAEALGIGTATGDYNGFASDADIDAALNDLAGATNQVRSTRQRVGSDIASLTTRRQFTQNLSDTIKTAEDKIAGSDLNDEAARQLALQLQDRFATASLRFAVRTESLVADLLGSGT